MENSNFVRLSVVVPVYGSERVLPVLVERLDGVLEALLGKGRYELILVCDCSPDGSWGVIEAISRARNWVRGIRLRMNAGQHNAIMAGLAAARGEVIVTMDDDLQHSPIDIPLLLAELERGFDVVFAKFRNRKHSWWKRLGSSFNDFVARLLIQKPKGLYLSPFRAMRTSIRRDVLRYNGPVFYLDGLILSVTRNVSSVEVEHFDRHAGTSGYSFRKSVSLWMKMATSFSLAPLRMTSVLGLVMAGIGFVLAILFIAQKFLLDLMPIGWSSLIVASLIIGGVQLLGLGMVGEYLGRVLLTLNAKPQYVVDRTVGFECADGASDRAVE